VGEGDPLVSICQLPSVIQVEEGDSVNMSCYYEVNSTKVMQIRVQWLWNCSEVQVQQNQNCNVKKTNIYNVTVNQISLDSLVLTSLQRHQSGRYICQVTVEIPSLSTTEGNGTIVDIKHKKHFFSVVPKKSIFQII
ncbi:transmembrane and immunoglobulin domain-containing protein 2-like isoform X1, partial [Arapaima gigas]